MPLSSLFQLIEDLADRIQRHSAALRQNEMVTRYALIDPLLRELGWDTENPDQVRPEYAPGSGRVDYALMRDGKAIVMIEAKKLDTPLKDKLGQAIQYCLTEGTPFFAVTDGRRWELYETHRPVPIADKLVVAFDLADHSPADVALKAMALWRHGVETGRLQLPQTSVVSPEAASPPESMPPQSLSVLSTAPSPSPSQLDESTTSHASLDAFPLSQLTPKRFDKPPIAVIFPDGSEKAITHWVDLTLQTITWLSDNRILTPDRCPIRFAKRHIVGLSPQHPDGKAFVGDKQVGSFHMEANYSGPDQCRNTLVILRHLEQNPDRFSVRFGSD